MENNKKKSKWNKEYKKIYNQKYYANNKKKLNMLSKKYNDNNKEKRRLYNAEYRKKNPEYWKNYKKTDKFKLYTRKYYINVLRPKKQKKEINNTPWNELLKLIEKNRILPYKKKRTNDDDYSILI